MTTMVGSEIVVKSSSATFFFAFWYVFLRSLYVSFFERKETEEDNVVGVMIEDDPGVTVMSESMSECCWGACCPDSQVD